MTTPAYAMCFEAERYMQEAWDEARAEGQEILAQLWKALAPGQEETFIQKLHEGLAIHPSFWSMEEEIPCFGDDEEGETLAMKAASLGLNQALGALLDAGARPDFAIGNTYPMREAASAGHLSSLRLLASRGALIEGPENQSVSPLAQAVSSGHVDCCFFLLEAGADSARMDRWGHTPAQSARKKGTTSSLAAADAIDAWAEARKLRASLERDIAPIAQPRPKAPKAL
jgi:hypothetical protein